MCIGVEERRTFRGAGIIGDLGLTPSEGYERADIYIQKLTPRAWRRLAGELFLKEGVRLGGYAGILVKADRPELADESPLFRFEEAEAVVRFDNAGYPLVLAIYRCPALREEVRRAVHACANSKYGLLDVRVA
jgi:hypothetical protein